MFQGKKMKIIKKVFKLAFLWMFVFIIGGLGGITLDRFVLPKLSSYDFFSKFDFIKKANENVTIINKTEQVITTEHSSINEIASHAATAVVNIASVSRSPSVSKPVVKNGLGIIIASDGLITTYRGAIIEKKAEYAIWTFDGASYKARLLGIDNFTNLAYLKINASNLPVIPFANSDDFEPGERLIAIGSYFGEYQNKFSAGFLSGVNKTFNLSGKTVSSSEKLEGVFETDFGSQPEYLGGAIIDYGGELVGIIGSAEIDNQNKYFQIPSNAVKKSMNLAIKNKLGERATLGIYYYSLTKTAAAANGFGRDRGAVVYSPSGRQGLAVIANTPAEKAGIKINDIIIAVNGEEVNLDNPLSNLISRYKKGEQAKLLIIRNGKEMEINTRF